MAKYLNDIGLLYLWGKITTAIGGKVDKVDGKGLSTEDYTTAEKTKLSGIADGAEVNVNSDWNASSGDAQILNKPTTMTPSAHTQAGTTITIADSGGYFTGSNTETVLQEIGLLLNGLETAIAAIVG